MTRLFSPGADPEPATRGGTFEAVEPATGHRLATVGLADARDIDDAVRAAGTAQPGWAGRRPTERAAVLRTAARLLERHRDEFAEWLVREGGAVRAKAAFEIDSALDELWVAAGLPTQPTGHLQPSVVGGQSISRRVPLGVVGVIAPWNFPLVLSLRAVAPALALGNAVVLKPDVHTAVAGGLLVARLFAAAGLPDGVLHVLPGDAVPGAALAEHPDVAAIAFTGSTAVGRQIGAAAGRDLKRALLELGGNNALIVLDDADLDAAASAGAWASFLHQGQICMAAGRHIVHESVFEEYVGRLVARAEKLTVGDPWAADVSLGPLINARQRDRVAGLLADAVTGGARVRTGGTAEGLFFKPTVLTGVSAAMPVFTEEIFGPVAPVVAVRDDDEAVAVANATPYGLVAAVQTGSAARGLAIADRLRTGIVHVNDQTVNDDAFVSFGGWGASGNGARYGAQHSADEFTRWQWLTVKDSAPAFPF
ncbi:aldehyde dehydrogenase family protein [Dactylosporangium sucinum]|uniref:Aldehyde dehydrogenase n=1 Tax=Dactylosporangium sucinum TaxID=1424081 RepID=A0A917UAN2_9ACTN|nr:aldehyde dehydrogenase family protein [Dactylosporangium sucinum]GGM70982.1 aldehyde dehydrogenase [Dactylosporangium sucinum]